MKYTYRTILIALLLLILSGCMYPTSELDKNQVPNEVQLEMVQAAVEHYQEQTGGLLPIRTKSNDTPIFEKYLIDFTTLKESNSIADVPGNAYENGGVYQYAILNPETNPQVKLIDLRLTEAIRSVKIRVNAFRDKHIYPPFGERIDDGIFEIDYDKIGIDSPPLIDSPYSDVTLPLVMDANGEIYVDYRIDLNNALQTYEHTYQEGDDIRFILAENAPFLPAYSVPYTIKNDEPVFMDTP
ncbi:hypothetical protein [Ornithinibacillus contaminans]|uniref:hypothetical protein n=1 Tax=Ornithinibacillus contaminans TaxID=694055 RepID=UPI00064DF9DF|nr:hypothetical protein [Ornithinibacillus contaminans]